MAYFSASGMTAGVARRLAKVAGADLFEIKPEVAYTAEDLNWRDKTSRSSWEMTNRAHRPVLRREDAKIGGYDVVFVGFPIWWYVAPTIVNSFLETYDFNGKTIILFATSGGSGFGNTEKELLPSLGDNTEVITWRMLSPKVTEAELAAGLSELNI